MRCNEVLRAVEKAAPLRFALDWDNSGLLIGRPEKQVNTVYLAVDATDEVIEHAVEANSDLLLTHHPMIFKALKRVTSDDFVARRVIELIRHDMAYAAMHTNFDVCCMGDAAAERLGLENTSILSVTCTEGDKAYGIGRTGQLKEKMTLGECGRLVKECFGLERVKIFGRLTEEIHTAAVLPGSGGSEIGTALLSDADVLITGDISHHEGIDANMQGISIIDAGHYGIEKIFVEFMKDYFEKNLPSVRVCCEGEQLPYRII